MTATFSILDPLAVPEEPGTVGVWEAAYALGVGCQHAGLPREPHKVPEVSGILRNLENGDPIIAATFAGYVKGWDSASPDAKRRDAARAGDALGSIRKTIDTYREA